MLFLPYSNGRKKLLPIKEIPKPLLRNLSPTTLIYCSDMMRITLLILGNIDTICLAYTMAKNATQYLPMHCYFPLLWWCSLKREIPYDDVLWKRSFLRLLITSSSLSASLGTLDWRKWQEFSTDYLSQKSEKSTIHKLLFTITVHYSLLLFMVLFTLKFCLFKGGCPLKATIGQYKIMLKQDNW